MKMTHFLPPSGNPGTSLQVNQGKLLIMSQQMNLFYSVSIMIPFRSCRWLKEEVNIANQSFFIPFSYISKSLIKTPPLPYFPESFSPLLEKRGRKVG